MTLKERISELFDKYSVELEVEEKQEVKFAVATLDSGQEIQTDAEAFAVGVSVFVVNDEGEQIPLPDGEYTLADGSMLVVAEGAVSEMKEAEAEVEAEEERRKKRCPKTKRGRSISRGMTREDVAGMIAEAIEATKAEFSSQIEERDAKITELSKQAAPAISRVKQPKKVEKVDLSKLTVKERVRALSNQFNS